MVCLIGTFKAIIACHLLPDSSQKGPIHDNKAILPTLTFMLHKLMLLPMVASDIAFA